MAINKQNLKVPTSEEARRYGSKGGKASVKARQDKKDLKKALEILLEKGYTNAKGETVSGAELLSMKLFEKAVKGDIRAFEVVRDTAGQKPIERVATASISSEDIKEVEDFFNK